MKKFRGTHDAPITIRARKGAKVILDGTDSLDDLEWQEHKNGIFKAKLDQDIWQLFADDKIMTPARWPNIHMTDENFFRLKEAMRMIVFGNSPLGTVTDARPRNDVSTTRLDEQHLDALPIRDQYNTTPLAEAGFSAEGAIAVLNIGSWMNLASKITSHEKGSNSFHYDSQFNNVDNWSARIANDMQPGNKWDYFLKRRYWHPHYYFLEGQAMLDTEREYWYNKDEKSLYFKPPAGKKPQDMALRGKRRSYMLNLQVCNYLNFDGIDFFGSTFYLMGCTNTTIQNSQLYSPSWNQFQIGKLGRFPVTSILNRPTTDPSPKLTGNKIINCQFSYLDGEGINIRGDGTILENCLFHDQQYTGLAMAVGLNLNRSIVKNCTLYRSGSSEGFRDGMILDSNRGWDIGGLAQDGSVFQLGGDITGHLPAILKNNWVHDTQKISYRYDAGKGVQVPNALGLVCNNVSWNAGNLQMKGDDHMVFNNSMLSRMGININTAPHWMSTNDRTITANNLSPQLDGFPKVKTSAPGILLTNKISPPSELRDPQNLDFRPRKNSSLASLGSKITSEDLPKGYPKELFEKFIQDDPMYIGAYRADDANYSIPGFQYEIASSPVPPNHSKTVKTDADLMWLSTYKPTSNQVYFGTSKSAVEVAQPDSSEFKGSQTNNIFHPGVLEMDQDYFWRVDNTLADGSISKGQVWQFKCGETQKATQPTPKTIALPLSQAITDLQDFSTWYKEDSSDKQEALHTFGQSALTKKGDLRLRHDGKNLYFMVKFDDIGRIREVPEGRNNSDHQTAWDTSITWKNADGKPAPYKLRISIFPNGTHDLAISGLYKGKQINLFKQFKPIRHVVRRNGSSMTAVLCLNLRIIKHFTKQMPKELFFNTGMHINGLPTLWAPALGDAGELIHDGRLILSSTPMITEAVK